MTEQEWLKATHSISSAPKSGMAICDKGFYKMFCETHLKEFKSPFAFRYLVSEKHADWIWSKFGAHNGVS